MRGHRRAGCPVPPQVEVKGDTGFTLVSLSQEDQESKEPPAQLDAEVAAAATAEAAAAEAATPGREDDETETMEEKASTTEDEKASGSSSATYKAGGNGTGKRTKAAGPLSETCRKSRWPNKTRAGKDLWRRAHIKTLVAVRFMQPVRMSLRKRKHALAKAPKSGETCVEAFLRLVQKYSLPLLFGLVLGVVYANVDVDYYEYWLGGAGCCEPGVDGVSLVGGCLSAANATAEGCLHCAGRLEECHWDMGPPVFHHALTPRFIINDIFMAFIFGIKEITESCLPGGSLNPIRQAMNPLFATVGGVVGPVGVYFVVCYLVHAAGGFAPGYDFADVAIGWGIPTATDISLAWMVALSAFGHGHAAIDYLLLLAVADDGVGMIIIAAFYGDPANPVKPVYLLITLGAMLAAYGLRRLGVIAWWAYVLGPGVASWIGLINAHLHPALALVFVIPFMPCHSCPRSVADKMLARCKKSKNNGGGGGQKVKPSLGSSTHGPRRRQRGVSHQLDRFERKLEI